MPFRIRKVVGSIPIGSTKMEIAAVKTAAISRLNTEIPQTGFGFDHLKGTPFRKECPSLFTVPQNLRWHFVLYVCGTGLSSPLSSARTSS